jgi:hypothetical protein
MRFIKKFEKFVEVVDAEPIVKPARPTTKPTTRPNRPSPIRRDKPSVDPAPKASAEDVANRFISLMTDNNEDIKKYVK